MFINVNYLIRELKKKLLIEKYLVNSSKDYELIVFEIENIKFYFYVNKNNLEYSLCVYEKDEYIFNKVQEVISDILLLERGEMKYEDNIISVYWFPMQSELYTLNTINEPQRKYVQ